MANHTSTFLMQRKMSYSLILIVIYIFLRLIPLNGIDLAAYSIENAIGVGNFFNLFIGSSQQNYFVMSIGLYPYITASLIIQIYIYIFSRGNKLNISPQRINKYTVIFSFLLTILQATLNLNELHLINDYENNFFKKLLVFEELVVGSMFCQWLVIKNKEKGVGGIGLFILMNILFGLVSNIIRFNSTDLTLPFIISICILIVIIVVENIEVKIPVLRTSIHNDFSSNSYISFKLNPISILPVMFTSAIFALLNTTFSFLSGVFGNASVLSLIHECLNTQIPMGGIIYLVLLLFITILFSFIIINPVTISENLLKNGDCIDGVHPGQETKRFLKIRLFICSLCGALIMMICVGISFLFSYLGIIDPNLSMIPLSFMLMAGIICNLFQEIKALKEFDMYRKFI